MRNAIRRQWLVTAVLILLQWIFFDSLSSRLVGTAFILCMSVFSVWRWSQTQNVPRSYRDAPPSPSQSHINTRILQARYGRFTPLRTYWGLAFLCAATGLSTAFPLQSGLVTLKYVALICFFADGLYLNWIILRDKSRI